MNSFRENGGGGRAMRSRETSAEAVRRRAARCTECFGGFSRIALAGGGARHGAAVLLCPRAPDLNLQDWGYGPYYHETFLERRGDWFLLPEDPFPAGTWLNARDLGDEPHLLPVEGIVTSPRGNLVVLAIDPETLRARPEQPADMWCDSGAPPPLQPWSELRIPRADLYTRTGHLLIAPAHMKGC